jgi:preprotein translocase subunit YajC
MPILHMLPLQLSTFFLAQSQLPPAPGESPSAPPSGTATTAAPGTPADPNALPSPGGGGGGTNQLFLIMLLVVGGMILFSILGQRRDRKKREAMISAIKKHDRVQTIGGVIGSVVEVKPDYVVLKVDESSNTRITFARSAVQQVLSVSPESPSGNGNGPPGGEKLKAES